jgi:hypothetical protein
MKKARLFRLLDNSSTKFYWGYCSELDVATSFGTVFLALMHVAIALVDFSFELLVSNSFADKYRQNAPCPDLIVPFPMERRVQSAKTHLLSLVYGSLYSAGDLVSSILWDLNSAFWV